MRARQITWHAFLFKTDTTMRKILTAILLATSLCLAAQVQVLRSGSQNVILKTQAVAPYLLLPINENAEECTMQVIVDNQCVQTLLVQLAKQGDIATYVPFALDKYDVSSLALNVYVPQAALVDSINWNAIQTATSFPYINTETYRPTYHYAPQYGWMGEPAAALYDAKNKQWNLYYQYNPYGLSWQNMHWGHASSTDMLHWTTATPSITPTSLGEAYPGSVVADKNNTSGLGKNLLLALYTTAAESQTQSLAYSKDAGNTFTLYKGNPILTDTDLESQHPYVFYNDQTQQWNMVLACGQQVKFYASTDLIQWTYLSSFSHASNSNASWVKPALINLPVRDTKESKWALIVSTTHGAPAGGSGTQYFIGDWDGHHFSVIQDDVTLSVPARWLDYGKDCCGITPFTNVPKDRKVVIAWMSNEQYAQQLPTTQFRSISTLPRELDIYRDNSNIYRIGVKPAKELKNLRGKETEQLHQAAIVEIDVNSNKGTAVVTLSNKQGEAFIITLDNEAHTFTMDRRQSGITDFSENFSTVTTAPLLLQQRTYHITLYIDRCSVEAFDEEGAWAMTNLTFPTVPYTDISVQNAKVKIYDINY